MQLYRLTNLLGQNSLIMYSHNNFSSQVSTHNNKVQYKEIKRKKKYIRCFYIGLS